MEGSPTGDEALLAMPRTQVTPRHDDERALVRAAQRGSADAVEELIRRYWPGTVRMAYVVVRSRTGAEDVAQEAMLASIRTLDRFDRGRPFGPWLHRIVTNKAVDWLRSEARRAQVPLSGPKEQQSTPDAPLSDEMVRALEGLTPEDRAIVAMTHLFGYSAKELAAMFEIKPGTVRSRLSRALAQLRASLSASTKDGDGDG